MTLPLLAGPYAASALFAAGPAPAQAADPQVEACGPVGEQSLLCSTVFRLTDDPDWAEFADRFSAPLRVLIILAVAYIVVRVSRRVIRRVVRRLETGDSETKLEQFRRRTGLALLDTSDQMPTARRVQRARTIGVVLRSIVTVLVWTVAALMALGELGVNLAPLVAGAGIAGIAIGFGAQTLVRDFLSGIFMLFEDQYGVGDVINVGEATGVVEGVSLRTTRLRDVEGVVWHVPNGEIHRVGNMSQQWSRALLDIEVAYDTDIPTATRVIKDTADAMWQDADWSRLILSEPEVWGVEGLGASSIVIRLVVQTRPLEQWRVARELRARIKRSFDEAGIEIPFPQQTVTFRTADLPPARPPRRSGADDEAGD
ncbi:MAG TPA: mechanosensitive ion channel family protein [Acidimicrobiia bacterium]